MAVLIDIRTFRLADGVDDDAFLAADRDAQAAFHLAYGAVRRTTARDGAGRWLVLSFWWDAATADAHTVDPLADLVADERVERFDDIGG